MTHKNEVALELIARRLESKRRTRASDEVQKDLYKIIDDYNDFVKDMDARFDKILNKVENI